MSYILDALRRAEAERQRGQAPALQQVAQPGLEPPAQRPAGAPRPAWLIGAAALAVVAVAGLGWWLGRLGTGNAPGEPVRLAHEPAAAPDVDRRAASPARPASGPPQPGAPAAPTAAPPPAPAAAGSAPPRAGPPPAAAADTARPPRPAAASTAAAMAEGPAAASSAAPAPTRPAPAPPPAHAGAPGAEAPPPPALPVQPAPLAGKPARPPADTPASMQSLPEPQRAAVLALRLGGIVHSQERSQSFVMRGSDLVREGEALAPGITLERVEPRSLLLRVEGALVRWVP